jgi:hypothetical protein
MGKGNATERVVMLLNWFATISRDDGRNTYEIGTAFENGRAQCHYWRLTVKEQTSIHHGGKYNDILYEGFTTKERTPGTRTIYGLASRMHGSGIVSDGEQCFIDNSAFYMRMGGNGGNGTGIFRNFKEVGNPMQMYAFVLESNRLSGKEDIRFLLDNIDAIPQSSYKTTNGILSSWDIGTLNKVMSTNLIDEADVSSSTSVYLYIIAQDTITYDLDYYKQQIPRTFPDPHNF